LGYGMELVEATVVPDYTFHVYPDDAGGAEQIKEFALQVTAQQGNVSASIARSRCARGDFANLFDHIFRFCYVASIDPVEALDSVYDIISKRGGEMRNGVWVKSEDL